MFCNCERFVTNKFRSDSPYMVAVFLHEILVPYRRKHVPVVARIPASFIPNVNTIKRSIELYKGRDFKKLFFSLEVNKGIVC